MCPLSTYPIWMKVNTSINRGEDLLARLLDPPPAPEAADVPAWWRGELARREARAGASAFELAVAGGLEADRPGWAPASGYQAALRPMIPGRPADAPPAFCSPEAAGNAPQARTTRLPPRGRRCVA